MVKFWYFLLGSLFGVEIQKQEEVCLMCCKLWKLFMTQSTYSLVKKVNCIFHGVWNTITFCFHNVYVINPLSRSVVILCYTRCLWVSLPLSCIWASVVINYLNAVFTWRSSRASKEEGILGAFDQFVFIYFTIFAIKMTKWHFVLLFDYPLHTFHMDWFYI